ncbi:MAG: hypothetical protein EBE86_000525 [Hormoscilla sp. GUM202]|nr:hypothetical protein [Hormoscilla sp. GUM202]
MILKSNLQSKSSFLKNFASKFYESAKEFRIKIARIVDRIWQNLNCVFVPETDELNAEAEQIIANQSIPAEDIFIYLTAKYGEADCFVSGNRELIKAIADFPCFTPEDFVQLFLTIG